jgi:MarR family transcriptional regulator, organic hydroperoxide resistance regulator
MIVNSCGESRLARPVKKRGKKPPSIGIGMLLREADTAFNRFLRQELAARGVTFGQFQHLRYLWVQNGLTQADLSRRIGIEMASSTAILDSLEAVGLITRARNVTDRRKVNVFLTPAGAALEKPLIARAAHANKQARQGLTDSQLATVFEHVGQIIANFKALRVAENDEEPESPRRTGNPDSTPRTATATLQPHGTRPLRVAPQRRG